MTTNSQYIVVYRAHGEMNMETKYYGPFDDFDLAYNFHNSLSAIGTYNDELHDGRRGVKYTQPLIKPQ